LQNLRPRIDFSNSRHTICVLCHPFRCLRKLVAFIVSNCCHAV
jgi:hypothetical protein